MTKNQELQNFLKLVDDLLSDHAKMFNNLYPNGFRKPSLNNEEYSLDLRQRTVQALKDISETGELN